MQHFACKLEIVLKKTIKRNAACSKSSYLSQSTGSVLGRLPMDGKIDFRSPVLSKLSHALIVHRLTIFQYPKSAPEFLELDI